MILNFNNFIIICVRYLDNKELINMHVATTKTGYCFLPEEMQEMCCKDSLVSMYRAGIIKDLGR